MTDWENGGEVKFWLFVAALVLAVAVSIALSVRDERAQKRRVIEQARRVIAWNTHSPFCNCADCKEMPL